MDEIKLKNVEAVQIDEGAFLDHIVHRAGDATAAAGFVGSLTPANLAEVEFLHNGVVNGQYENLSLQYVNVDENVVTFGLEET